MDRIQTERLILMPLRLDQLKLALEDLPDLEKQLDVRINASIFDEPVRKAVRIKLIKMVENEALNHAWLTYWLIISRKGSVAMGAIGFKGFPNARGSVEIGYGLSAEFRRKGFMQEAVHALTNWAFSFPICREIRADHVLETNIASQKVLKNTGFHLKEQSEDGQFWILKQRDIRTKGNQQ